MPHSLARVEPECSDLAANAGVRRMARAVKPYRCVEKCFVERRICGVGDVVRLIMCWLMVLGLSDRSDVHFPYPAGM